MSRVSQGGASRQAAGRRSSSAEELSLRLETQLFEVVEREGVTISTSRLDESRMSNRAKRGIRRRSFVCRTQPSLNTNLLTEVPQTSFIHPVTILDQELFAHLEARRTAEEAASTVFEGAAQLSHRVPVRFSSHAPSDHVLQFHVPARPMVEVVRDPFGQTVRDWMAPYQIPPSIEGMVSAAQDLCVEEIDPRLFLEQFTPGQAEVAYAQRYSLISKLVAPFIRWEEASRGASNVDYQVTSNEKIKEEECVPDIEMGETVKLGQVVKGGRPEEKMSAQVREGGLDVSSLSHASDDQFTPADPDVAYRGSYGVLAWMKRRARAFVGLFDWTVKEVEEEVREQVEIVEEEALEVVEQVRETWAVPVLVPRLHTMRVMAGFFALLFVVSIPAGAVSLSRSFGSSVQDVKAQSAAALSEVQAALDGSSADQLEAWAQASERFGNAREALTRANTLALGLAQALPQTRAQYGSAQSLLTAGERTSQAAKLLLGGLVRALDDRNRLRPDERIGIFLTYLDYASPLLEEALEALEKVQPDSLPDEVRTRVAELRSLVGTGKASFQETKTLLTFLRTALGHEAPRTYLFVFQNHAELRPTGGFMGSVAQVTFDRGEIQEVSVPGGGPYDLRNQLRKRVVPPGPLQLVGGRWEFQDANWFPDFPASADKIRWFWSYAGQPTLDGVVAINDTLLEQLLRVTGPIQMPEYGKTLSADNVIFELQKSVELEYDKKENKPKKIIADLLPRLLSRLKAGSREEWLKLAEVGLQALETKDVQVWMTRPEEESLVEHYDWSSRLKPTQGDALAIIEANIAGQKSDASIHERVDHEVEVAEDGSITDTVILTRRHDAMRGEMFKGVNNVSYVRVYVPQGSRLLEAEGFEAPSSSLFEVPLAEDPMDQDLERLVQAVSSSVAQVDVTHEFGRTAFGGWIQLRPGETRTSRFKYTLPFTVFDVAERTGEGRGGNNGEARRAAYMLLLTSQPGKTLRTVYTRVHLPASWQARWTNQLSGSLPLALETVWDRDRVLAGLFDVMR